MDIDMAQERLQWAKYHLVGARACLHWARNNASTPASVDWAVQNFYRQLDNVWACQCMVRGEGAGL